MSAGPLSHRPVFYIYVIKALLRNVQTKSTILTFSKVVVNLSQNAILFVSFKPYLPFTQIHIHKKTDFCFFLWHLCMFNCVS